MDLLNALSQSFATNEYRLLIIDSIMNCFRVDYCGRGELAERQQKLNQFLSRLSHIAEGEQGPNQADQVSCLHAQSLTSACSWYSNPLIPSCLPAANSHRRTKSSPIPAPTLCSLELMAASPWVGTSSLMHLPPAFS